MLRNGSSLSAEGDSNDEAERWVKASSMEEDEQNAILASLKPDHLLRTALYRPAVGQESRYDIPLAGANRPTIDDRIVDIRRNGYAQLASMHLPYLQDSYGDTMILIDPPGIRQSDQTYDLFDRIQERYSKPIFMDSKKLYALNSPYFDKALGPTAQHRVLRRRKLVGRLPANVKYVVDLTPPSEGDEAVILTLELSCSKGVRLWGLASERWRISSTLIGGTDEFIPLPSHAPEDLSANTTETDGTMPAVLSVAPKASSVQLQDHPVQQIEAYVVPIDYSPIRHRFAIERVLLAIDGQDPFLNSAPKVWTTYAVAKNLGIKTSLLTDYIVRWLRAPPNTYFLEVLPEVSLEMADGLQCHDLCRDVFALLVGEAALNFVCQIPSDSKHNAHGREMGDLPEKYLTRVQYARGVFIDRIDREFQYLEQMEWVENLTEYKTVVQKMDDSPEHKQALNELSRSLKDYIRAAIYRSISSDYNAMPNPVQDTREPSELGSIFPYTTFYETWNNLRTYRERYFTRSFWDILSCLSSTNDTFIKNGSWTLRLDPLHGYTIANGWTAMSVSLQKAGKFRKVPLRELRESIESCRRLIDLTPALTLGNLALERIETQLEVPEKSTAHSSTKGNVSQNLKSLPFRTTSATSTCAEVASTNPYLQHDIPSQDKWPTDTSFQTGPTGSLAGVEYAGKDAYWRDPGLPPDYNTHHAIDHDSFFNLQIFFRQVHGFLHDYARRMLASPNRDQRDQFELGLTNTLTCLQDTELKYLPLWAGGNDDDTNGVFNDDVPIAEGGFSTPGPHIHTEGSSAGSSDFDLVSSSGETFDTSTVVNDGFTDTLDRRRVVVADDDWGHILGRNQDRRSRERDEMTLDSESSWGEILTPASLDAMSLPELETHKNETHKTEDKGKGKATEPDCLDDIFMEEQEDDENEEMDYDVEEYGECSDEEYDSDETANLRANYEYVFSEHGKTLIEAQRADPQENLQDEKDAKAIIGYRIHEEDDMATQ